MAPKPAQGRTERRQLRPALNAQKSGVLALLHPTGSDSTRNAGDLKFENISLVLTHRSEGIDHSGQLSFPGGKSGPHETAVETACREAYEEIGVSPSEIRIIGKLSGLYIQHSNNYVHPVIGWMESMPIFRLNPAEVQEAFSIPLADLVSEKYQEREYWTIRDHGLHVPFWNIHDVPLWGATAMMISELVSVCREYLRENKEQTTS
jgi:8-oxo-dGTP pyrophosphatase MutT (NUDIX family)